MHIKRIKSLFALSLCAMLTSQNAILIANGEELDKSLENEITSIPSSKLQLETQENNLITDEVTSEDINSDEELTNESIENTSDNSDTQVDPEQNKKYIMGEKTSRNTASLDNIETVTLTNPNSIGCGTVTADSLNVRSGSSTSHEIIGTLKLGEIVDVIGKSNGWYKIDFQGKEGYISAVYLELKPIEKGIDVSKWNGDIDWKSVKDAGADYVIIRAGYGRSTVDEKFYQNIEGAREAGLKIGIYWFSYASSVENAKIEAQKCIEVISNYKESITYPVFFDYEYASRDYAEKQGVTITKELATEMANTFINTVKSAGYVTGLYTNKDFGNKYFSEDIINSNNLWVAQYASKNTYGRAHDMWQFTEKGIINGINGNVDLNYTCLIPEGVTINNTNADNNNNNVDNNTNADNNNNNNVDNNNNADNNTSITSENGVTTANLNLRQGTSTSSKILTTIPKGKTIEILDKSNTSWYRVRYNGKTGYVSSQYISINGNSNSNNNTSTTSENGVTTANLNLRQGTSTSSKILTTIPKGKTIEILDKSNTSWYRVRYNGKIGYVSSQYISINGNSNSNNNTSITSQKGVTTANLNLRRGTSTSSKILTTIPKGKTIEILDRSNASWYKVKYSGKTGYVSSKYIRL